VVPASDPEFAGDALARAGPVWFSAFGPGPPGKAVLREFVLGGLTKVVIHPDAEAHPEVQVRGTECATGQPIHFSYGTYDPDDRVVTIPADQHTDDTGYMIFPRSGEYMISVSAGSQFLGAVVLQVG